jgi:methyltransferase (TIGR00027 family)
MSKTAPITGVEDTAILVATYRATETARTKPLIRDPLAATLVGERGPALVRGLRAPKTSAWQVIVRTAVIDELILAAVAGGVDTVLNLGAGLDTRPYRLALPAALRWIEADFPTMIAYKEGKLAGEAPRCQLRRAGVDLANAAERQRFLDGVGGQRVLVLTEGVVPYLSVEEAGALADDLHARPNFDGWIVDYFAPELMARTAKMRVRRRMQNAPFKFQPPDWHAFFGRHGWRVRDMRYLPIEGAKRGRPIPLAGWMRLLITLSPAEKRVGMSKSLGYALLERVPYGTL